MDPRSKLGLGNRGITGAQQAKDVTGAPHEQVAADRGLKNAAAGQSIELLNRLIASAGYESYLEIGVQNGFTFFEILARYRDGVDPDFRFDIAARGDLETRFYAMTSDAFFLAQAARKYDLVFIDGWHSFDQALRDFCNALSVLREGGAIVVDDVYPNDVFGALASQSEAIEARKSHGLDHGPNQRAWSGDVFKLVLTLHDYFPCLDFVTIRNPDNPYHKPQTLVWHGARQDFKPLLNSVEKIARTTWFDLTTLERAFRFASFAEAIQRFESAARR